MCRQSLTMIFRPGFGVRLRSRRRLSYLDVDIGDPSVVVLLLGDVQARLLGKLAEQAQSFAPRGGKHQRRALDTQVGVLYNSQSHRGGC